MNEAVVTMIGNLTADPELKVVGEGVSRSRLRLAVNRRRFDRAADKWVDGDALFFDVFCWRQLADNVAASVRKGNRILVYGKIIQREYEKDGVTRTVTEIEAITVAADLAFATATVKKARRDEVPPPDDSWGLPPAHTTVDPLTGEVAAEPAPAAA